MISLNVLDYNSLQEFIDALDGTLSLLVSDLTQCMRLSIAHEELYLQVLDIFLLRIKYEYDISDVSNMIVGNARITIPLTADMTYIYSDATEI